MTTRITSDSDPRLPRPDSYTHHLESQLARANAEHRRRSVQRRVIAACGVIAAALAVAWWRANR